MKTPCLIGPDPKRAPLSVRLFPTGSGADAYEVTGIASLCDWVVMSDMMRPYCKVRINRQGDAPGTIFLSMRNPVAALQFFRFDILPKLDRPIILVSGSEDATLPSQVDTRWPRFDANVQEVISDILSSPKLIHWFAENLDASFSDRVSPLPTGMVFADNRIPPALSRPAVPALASRPLQVLSGHRIRPGRQWDMRRNVSLMAMSAWSKFTTHLTEEVSEERFLQMIAEHSFVLCVEGGGLDPSPKAWQALHYGAIPIIRKSALWEAYSELPCVAVDEWDADCITPHKLRAWKAELQERFDSSDERERLLEKLTLGHWWDKIVSAGLPKVPATVVENTRRIVIVCPGQVVSGGPEALHQLGSALSKAGHEVSMCYFPFDKRFTVPPLQYRSYNVPVCQFDEIADAKMVLPEARTGFARHFRPEQVWIWWLSVDNYKGELTDGAACDHSERHLPLRQMRNMNHLSQSAYATAFLKENGLSSKPLSDYLTAEHIQRKCPVKEKERIILYNPKKADMVTKAIIAALPQERFVPIAGLDRNSVAHELARAALYIDFGPHPGKDRLPREAAMAGCCILTGRRGAAGNPDDISIPEFYKIDEEAVDFYQSVCLAIFDILDRSEDLRKDFDGYRQRIIAEEEAFRMQVSDVFAKPERTGMEQSTGSSVRRLRRNNIEEATLPTSHGEIGGTTDNALSDPVFDGAVVKGGDSTSVSSADVADIRKALAKLDGAGLETGIVHLLTLLFEKRPGDFGLLADIGYAHLSSGNLADAVRAFDEVLVHKPRSPRVWLGLIKAALAGPDPKRAKQRVEAALSALPEHPAVVSEAARALMQLGFDNEAKICLERILAGEAAGNAKLTMLLMKLRQKMNDHEVIDARFPSNEFKQVEAWFARVRSALMQGDITLALDLSDKVRSLFPDHPEAVRLHAAALERAGRLNEAVSILEDLHARSIALPGATIDLANAYMQSGQPDVADQYYRKVPKSHASYERALTSRVRLAEARGDLTSALELLEAGIASKSGSDLPLRERQDRSALTRWLPWLADLADRVGRPGVAQAALSRLGTMLPSLDDGQLTSVLTWSNLHDQTRLVAEAIKEASTREELKLELAIAILRNARAGALVPVIEPELTARVKPEQRDALRAKIVHLDNGPLASLDALRSERIPNRAPKRALALAQALIAAGQSGLARRYLRLCLRKWPDSLPLSKAFIEASCKSGQPKEAQDWLDAQPRRGREQAVDTLRLDIALETGQLEEALVLLKSEVAAGRRSSGNNKLLRVLIALGRLEEAESAMAAMRADSALPSKWTAHVGVQFVGQLLNELRFFKRFRAADLPAEPTSDEAANNFAAASRVIDVWQAAQVVPHGSTPSSVPRCIFQYWDREAVPPELSRVMQSWSCLPGWKYRLWHRRDAIAWLRATFGQEHSKAFASAGKPEAESDFLRLCLLLADGGIYADTDDRLVGRPEDLLACGPGLVLFREPFGAIENNLICAPKGHPVLERAVHFACEALLRGDKDIVWLRAGPGFLTRMVALSILENSDVNGGDNLTILPLTEMGQYVQPHINLTHKKSSKHWKNNGKSVNLIVEDALRSFVRTKEEHSRNRYTWGRAER